MKVLYTVYWKLKEENTIDTSGNPEDSHHSYNGGVDRNEVTLHLLQHNPHHRQDDDEHVQLVPPDTHTHTKINISLLHI